ncbi:DUF4410 domain-containing protein [Polycladidibacter stylochi]|uniref:DUF4410 domain-containing protein n=1 Tax=Polycladidibacter stylochi TaxID=1807766 RepID=UPI00082EFABC|nr:DUF4410 domain-containing protein [Pseudovibrio stylochi]
MQIVSNKFSELIYNYTRSTYAFQKVIRIKHAANTKAEAEKLTGPVAVVSGQITEFEDGNATARAMIGFGFGSSHFDADVVVSDARTGTDLGHIKVDKHSWLLGGAIASTQDARSFMPVAAQSIADELKKSKL